MLLVEAMAYFSWQICRRIVPQVSKLDNIVGDPMHHMIYINKDDISMSICLFERFVLQNPSHLKCYAISQ